MPLSSGRCDIAKIDREMSSLMESVSKALSHSVKDTKAAQAPFFKTFIIKFNQIMKYNYKSSSLGRM